MSYLDSATATAPADELDLLACCLQGWPTDDLDLIPADFDDPKRGACWQALLHITGEGRSVDPAGVRHVLGDTAASWILDVYGRPVVPANAPALADRVKRASETRALQDLARGLMQRTATDNPDPAAISDWLRSRIDQDTGRVKATTALSDVLPGLVDQMELGTPPGLSTPWPRLDRLIHGLAPNRLYVVAARPGQGKSLIGQNLAWHWATRHQSPTYFANLEMSADELTTRFMSQAATVDLSALQGANLSEEEWGRIGDATPLLNAAPIHICDDTHQTVDSIHAGARRIQRRHGLGLIVVDYLQLVTPRDPRLPREQQVSEVSRALKLMAKSLGVPVVAMSQLRRPADRNTTRPPTLSDLRESGAIEQDADAVLMLHTPDEDAPWEADLIVGKARAGRCGTVPLHLRTHIATIDPGHHTKQEES